MISPFGFLMAPFEVGCVCQTCSGRGSLMDSPGLFPALTGDKTGSVRGWRGRFRQDGRCRQHPVGRSLFQEPPISYTMRMPTATGIRDQYVYAVCFMHVSSGRRRVQTSAFHLTKWKETARGPDRPPPALQGFAAAVKKASGRSLRASRWSQRASSRAW